MSRSAKQRKHKAFQIIFCMAILMLMSSCARLNSIHRESDFGNNARTISIDAKQRFLLGRYTNEKIEKICAEPSPDVFSAFAASLSGSAKFKAFEAALSASSSENAATIGIRTQAIQLLRDGMYRICEGALNGDVTKDEFVDLHRRYQRIMVTLVAIEQLTGAVRPPSVAIQTSALAGRPARLNELQSSLEDARKKVDELTKKVNDEGKNKLSENTASEEGSDATCAAPGENDDITNDSNCADYLTAKKNLDDANKNVATLDEKIKQARSEMVNSASGTVEFVNQTPSSFQLDSDSVEHISDTVKLMVNSMFRLDPDSAIEAYAQSDCPIVFKIKRRLDEANKIRSTKSIINDFESIPNPDIFQDELLKYRSSDLEITVKNNNLANMFEKRAIDEYKQEKGISSDTPNPEAKKAFNMDYGVCEALTLSINDRIHDNDS